MTCFDNQYDESGVLNFNDESIVSHTISPQSSEIGCQAMTEDARILGSGNAFIQTFFNFACLLTIHRQSVC